MEKRAHAAARVWPTLANALGEGFDEKFVVFAGEYPLPFMGGALADGHAFARWLSRRGELPAAARLEVFSVDLRFMPTHNGLRRRRWPTCKAAWLNQPRQLVIAFRLPWVGERWLYVPPGRR